MAASETVQQLFSKHPVTEIRELEKKTRHEIETKKEDLRQMVGERYRDLIEAADTIAEMKKCASNLRDSVHHLQKYTSSELKNGKTTPTTSKSKHSTYSVDSYMQLSAQVKMLMEVSETIWSRVESGNMIEATHLYMQSRQVLKNLNLDGSTTYCPILSWFPVLGQQAQALDNLRSTILTECRNLMKDNKLHSKSLAEALCSIILLEESDLTKAFKEFMNARLSAITLKFEASEEIGATKLCKVVTVLAATIKQVHTLFVAPVESSENTEEATKKRPKSARNKDIDAGLVQHVLRESYRSFSENYTDGCGASQKEKRWDKHLPDSVTSRSSLTSPNSNLLLASSVIQSTCKQWLLNCEKSIKDGTTCILSYVTTFKALATLRQSLWNTLSEVSDTIKQSTDADSWRVESRDSEITEWDQACLSTLGRQLSMWDEIIKGLFLVKVKTLSKNLFSNLLLNGKEILNEALEGLKTPNQVAEATSSFIWHELPSDILPDTAWRQVSVKKCKEVKGGLGLKALTVTPTLHKACQQLNLSMKQVLNDLSYYIPGNKKEGATKGNLERKDSNDRAIPFISKEERSLICADFQDACAHCLKEFLKMLTVHRTSLLDKQRAGKSCSEEILFLAMFCRNFCQLCGEFYTGCVIGTNTDQTPLKRQSSTSMTSSMMIQSIQPRTSPIWDEIGSEMSTESHKFLQLWSDAMIKKAVITFKSQMLNLSSAIHFFDTLPTWDNVKIQEESETGSQIESEIKLPMAVSWPVQELLYYICENISKVGGHSISRSTLQNVTGTLMDGVFHTFLELKKFVSETTQQNGVSVETPQSLPFVVTQPWALQKLFDLRTLYGLLFSSNEGKPSKNESSYHIPDDVYSELVDWLESYIDPFDLDVFAPHLTKNIQRSVHCSSVMLGFITTPDKSDSYQSSHTLSKSGANSHNILPLTTDCGRFSYLPISSRMSKSDTVALPASIKNHLPLSSALKQLTEVDKKMEGGRKQSLYSKLGALSSSWLSMATSEN